jgi:hypothetical protein
MEIGKIVREVELLPESEPDRTPLEEPAPALEPMHEPASGRA